MSSDMTKTNLCNFALGHIGIRQGLDDFDTDTSAEAQSCRLYFDKTVEEMLEDFEWPFATKTLALALIEEDPDDENLYSYQYPSDCLFFRRIQSGLFPDARETMEYYRISASSSDKIILTNKQDAIGEYTANFAVDPGRWSSNFIFATSYRLASRIAPGLTGGDPFKLGQVCLQLYGLSIKKAQAKAANEEQPKQMQDSPSILSRI